MTLSNLCLRIIDKNTEGSPFISSFQEWKNILLIKILQCSYWVDNSIDIFFGRIPFRISKVLHFTGNHMFFLHLMIKGCKILWDKLLNASLDREILPPYFPFEFRVKILTLDTHNASYCFRTIRNVSAPQQKVWKHTVCQHSTLAQSLCDTDKRKITKEA